MFLKDFYVIGCLLYWQWSLQSPIIPISGSRDPTDNWAQSEWSAKGSVRDWEGASFKMKCKTSSRILTCEHVTEPRVEVWRYFLPWLSDDHRKLLHINQKWIDWSASSRKINLCPFFMVCRILMKTKSSSGFAADSNSNLSYWISAMSLLCTYKFTNPGEDAPFPTSVGVYVFTQGWNLICMSVPAPYDIILFQQLCSSSRKKKNYLQENTLKIHSKYHNMLYVIQIKVCPLCKCLIYLKHHL